MKISEHIRYVGVTDHRNILFENQWTLPYGVAYNSYLIVDEKIALIDTAAASFGDDFLDNIREEIGGQKDRLPDNKPYGAGPLCIDFPYPQDLSGNYHNRQRQDSSYDRRLSGNYG